MGFFQSAETWIQNLIAAIQTAEQVAEADIKAAISWVNSHVGDVANEAATTVKGIESALASLQAAGVQLPAQTDEAIRDANAAVAALNAYAAGIQANAGTAQSLVQGYVAAKQALASTSNAAATLAASPNASPVIPVK